MSSIGPEHHVGASYLGGGRCRFSVWAPLAQRVDVDLVDPDGRTFRLDPQEGGYHEVIAADIHPGCRYFYRVDGQGKLPDPASRSQPEGVHGPSQVLDTGFAWHDGSWHGLPLEQYIIYEVHVGTFSPEGTFDGVASCLAEIKELGVTAIELMPVAQFPGRRNWGYDGVFPFAVQDSYGGPAGLKRLVDACHREGLAVALDVVYNHLGPEGNYLARFAPYFNDRCHTPWGPAINYDGPYGDGVREFFVQNALTWITEFHIDALRLDALHAIADASPLPFLRELAEAVHEAGKQLGQAVCLFAESDRNDARIVMPPASGGLGMDALWNDDFHHALHTAVTGEKAGYYADFGGFPDLAKAYAGGFVYTGQYSTYRKRRQGSPSDALPASTLVVFSQNHDQVGNRRLGERLSQIVPIEKLKLAAGAVLLSPYIPLLFMGEEYGETAPFLYFTSHNDARVVEATRAGRRAEFASFAWQDEPPDPQDESTFLRSRLNRQLRREGWRRELYDFYRRLIALRKDLPALARLDRQSMTVIAFEEARVLAVQRRTETQECLVGFNFGERPASPQLPLAGGIWLKQLDSGAEPGSPSEIRSTGEANLFLAPYTLAVYTREEP